MTDDVDPRDDSTDSTTEAVRFGLDGIVHEIDLDPAEARASAPRSRRTSRPAGARP